MTDATAVVITIVGAGPRGVGVLERIAANIGSTAPGVPLRIHLVDPFAPGGGRIWRTEQSPLLKLNSMAEDVTMFTDASSTIEGPIVAGPSLSEWAEGIRNGTIVDAPAPPALLTQIHQLTAQSFPTRQLQSLYLDWFYRQAVSALPSTVSVVVHRAHAVSASESRITLEDGSVITTDLVLYALGHIESAPQPEHVELAAFAAAHSLAYLPPSYTADADLHSLEAGADLIVRGMGLASVDLVVLLTEGRGGTFSRDPGGALRYRASGLEPRIHLGSRRGVPYHSKISSTLQAARAKPRYFTAEIARQLDATVTGLSLRADIWPLIAKEMLWGYYHELFLGHPDRVSGDFDTFTTRLDRVGWNSPDLRTLVAEYVPYLIDRLDLEQLDRPLNEVAFADLGAMQEHLRDYIRSDLLLRSAPAHSANLALFYSLLYSLFDLGSISGSANFTAKSRVEEFGDWWQNLFSYIASGPPAHRLEELLALSEAGIVQFLGAEVAITAEITESKGQFVARSGSVAGVTTAQALVDARLPSSDVTRTLNPVIASLLASGQASIEQVTDHHYSGHTGKLRVDAASSRLLNRTGEPQHRQFAIGPYTRAPFVGAFSRPGTNAVSFRENDRVARAILQAAVQFGRRVPRSGEAAERVVV